MNIYAIICKYKAGVLSPNKILLIKLILSFS